MKSCIPSWPVQQGCRRLCLVLVVVCGCSEPSSLSNQIESSGPASPAISTRKTSAEGDKAATAVTLASEQRPKQLASDVASENREGPRPSGKASSTPDVEKQADNSRKPSPAFEFEPPFPVRPNPFAPPDRDSAPVAQTRSNDSGDNVVLQGFAKVGELRAVLLIDGQVATLAAGQGRGGVVVMEISPPEVTLRRGRYVWKASLAKSHEDRTRR
ncbi:MAG: hypothetical protein KDA42_08815 [Planctomycetales bacterium]|nr:hypothetical protein [Planctomycetales bacterium]